MTGIKRLTPPQSRKVNSLIKKECCNCDNGHCILLDDGEECVCPQLISYSLLCKWFQTAVLPLDKLLYAELFKTEDKKRCTECGTSFASTSNSVKYCRECVCPQLISYSLLCKWFQTAVLPLDKLLYAELFKTEDKKRCTECGTSFASTSNSVKYCPDCRKRITRRQAAERMRKRRALVT